MVRLFLFLRGIYSPVKKFVLYHANSIFKICEQNLWPRLFVYTVLFLLFIIFVLYYLSMFSMSVYTFCDFFIDDIRGFFSNDIKNIKHL